ncbi:hypothetical protein GJ496_007516 [Pomphorhynchus laevis]|nr:hypothetical protein GJ496_007516 [Pomphorhynchus laevis]
MWRFQDHCESTFECRPIYSSSMGRRKMKGSSGIQYSNIDLKDAYLQLPIEPNTINIAPPIFQRYIDRHLENIPMVAAYLDDIIVTGLQTYSRALSKMPMKEEVNKRTSMERVHMLLEYDAPKIGFSADESSRTSLNYPFIHRLRRYLESDWPNKCEINYSLTRLEKKRIIIRKWNDSMITTNRRSRKIANTGSRDTTFGIQEYTQ